MDKCCFAKTGFKSGRDIAKAVVSVAGQPTHVFWMRTWDTDPDQRREAETFAPVRLLHLQVITDPYLEADGTEEVLLTGLVTILTTGATYTRPAKQTISGVEAQL